MLPILYSFRRCPYAIRARLALAYSRVTVELREVVLKDKPLCMLELSPKSTVPVLSLPDGKVIEESFEIMLWALQQHDENNWLAPHLQEPTQKLVKQNDQEFKPWLDKYKYADRHPEESQEYYREQAETFLSSLEQLLSEHRYLLADHISLADMAIFPFIRQFYFVHSSWFDQSPYQKIRVWLQEHLNSQLFETVMPKYSQWHAGDPVVIFP